MASEKGQRLDKGKYRRGDEDMKGQDRLEEWVPAQNRIAKKFPSYFTLATSRRVTIVVGAG